jgi:hypothetical protein
MTQNAHMPLTRLDTMGIDTDSRTAGTASAARSYDTTQREAVLVTWICCRSTVYATETRNGCWRCR